MRTTLTLDPDVAARLDQRRRTEGRPLKAIVNDALRAGLDALEEAPDSKRKPYRTRAVSLGGSLVGDIANIHEVLSAVEGDWRG